jgi:hypothetical protein
MMIMANARKVRAWGTENGHPMARGAIGSALREEWDMAHPDDPYEPGMNGSARADDSSDLDELFPPAGDRDLGDTGETRPAPPKSTPRVQGRPAGHGLRGLLGGKQDKSGKGKAKKKPRVSTEDLLGSLWRGAAKLAAPLPPLQRTLRVQAPVAGLLLEDAVRDTALDAMLQPLARFADAGRTVSALLGPPVFVTAITLHGAQAAAAGEDPNPLFMAIASEGLRSSLMTWMDVAGPKFELAVRREKEFEDKYGADVDQFMQWLFSPPPQTQAEAEADEAMIRRTMGIDDLANTM